MYICAQLFDKVAAQKSTAMQKAAAEAVGPKLEEVRDATCRLTDVPQSMRIALHMIVCEYMCVVLSTICACACASAYSVRCYCLSLDSMELIPMVSTHKHALLSNTSLPLGTSPAGQIQPRAHQ